MIQRGGASHVPPSAETRSALAITTSEGFDQCIHTTPLVDKIAEALAESRNLNPTGGIETRAR